MDGFTACLSQVFPIHVSKNEQDYSESISMHHYGAIIPQNYLLESIFKVLLVKPNLSVQCSVLKLREATQTRN
jgi:hypothetical protein